MDTDKLSVFVCVQCFVHLRFQIAYYQVFLTLPSRHAWGFLLDPSGLDTQMQAFKYPRSGYVHFSQGLSDRVSKDLFKFFISHSHNKSTLLVHCGW